MAVECSLARQRVVARPIADNLATNQLKHRSPLYTTVNIEVGLWSRERDDNARGVPEVHSHCSLTNTWGLLCVPRMILPLLQLIWTTTVMMSL